MVPTAAMVTAKATEDTRTVMVMATALQGLVVSSNKWLHRITSNS